MLLKFTDNISNVLIKYYGIKENDVCLRLAEYKLQNIIICKVLYKGQIVLCEKSNLEELK
jgi:hypothetical protein